MMFRKKIFYRFFCDVIVCPSKLGKEDLKSFFGAKNATVLLNPMIDRFKVKENISSNSIIISFLGRLNPTKGVIDLVKAYIKYRTNKNKWTSTGTASYHSADCKLDPAQ